MCHKYHVKHTYKQCSLDRLKSGSKRDTNETPTYAVPVHAPQTNISLSGGGGYNQASCVYFAKGCGGWVFAGINGVVLCGCGGSSCL